jgi:thioredoxin reductase
MLEQHEVVVVGGGPGGLSAALAAATAGARVTLIDAYSQQGGQYYRQPPPRMLEQSNAHQREGQHLIQRVREAGVRIIPDTLVASASAERKLMCVGPNGSYLAQARALIIAAGAYERPVAFPGWTLPGVLLTGGVQALLYQHVLPGKRVLLAGTGPLQLVVAKKLLDAGASVVAVLEGAYMLEKAILRATAMWGQWERMLEGAKGIQTMLAHGTPYRMGWGLVRAHGTTQVTGATIARLDRNWRVIPGTQREVECDTIGMGYGFVPFNALSRTSGAQQVWRPDLGGEVPVRTLYFETTVEKIYAVGDGAGIDGVHMSEMEGEIAGLHAAAMLGHGKDSLEAKIEPVRRRIHAEARFQRLYSHLFTPGPGVYELAEDDTLVCRCEGVTYGKLREMARDTDGVAQEIKNGARVSMGECQGRMCGHMAMNALAGLTGKSVPEVGAFPQRPPIFPLPVSALAGLAEEE